MDVRDKPTEHEECVPGTVVCTVGDFFECGFAA